MNNQHKHITGYRDLSQAEIDLMNDIKAKGAEVEVLIKKLTAMQDAEFNALCMVRGGSEEDEAHNMRQRQFEVIDKARIWSGLATVEIQSGFMKLIRSVARPTTFC